MKIIISVILASASLVLSAPAQGLVPPTPPAPTVGLAWNKSTLATVTNYFVYYGVSHTVYTNKVAVGNVAQTTLTLSPSLRGVQVFFAVTAQAKNLESAFSNEVTATPDAVPDAPLVTGATVMASTQSFIIPMAGNTNDLYQLRVELSPVLAGH